MCRTVTLTGQSIEDLENEILKFKVPSKAKLLQVQDLVVDGTVTVTTILFSDTKGNVVMKQGTARRKKGDQFSKVTGHLLAMLRAT